MEEFATYDNTITLDMPLKASESLKDQSNVPYDVWSAGYKETGPINATLSQKVICYDTETTGVNPWEYRFLVVSFWDLSKPISELVTFASFDEEALTRDVANYLNEEMPDVLVQYNNGFDERCLLTRFMQYQVAVPGWNDIKQVDVMDILKKGTTQSIASSQPTGSEEQWLTYFFGENKPFTIEECFEGVRNNDLTRFILRNRSCVESEGSLYLLFRSVTDVEPTESPQELVTVSNITEARVAGQAIVKCPTCAADNNVRIPSTGNNCWRCLGSLPDPTEANVLKEVVREFDFSAVGAKASK